MLIIGMNSSLSHHHWKRIGLTATVTYGPMGRKTYGLVEHEANGASQSASNSNTPSAAKARSDIAAHWKPSLEL